MVGVSDTAKSLQGVYRNLSAVCLVFARNHKEGGGVEVQSVADSLNKDTVTSP
jgi:hypothetical protein